MKQRWRKRSAGVDEAAARIHYAQAHARVDTADSSIRGGQGFGLFFKPNWNSQPKIAASRRDAPGSSAAGLYSTAGGAWGLVASTVL